jgi:hypothetical protein
MEVEAEVMAEENRIIMADLAIMDPGHFDTFIYYYGV